MPESIHEKLKRVRKPHVHITMDIDGEGLPVHELPFVVGVMGDFVGDPDPDDPPKPLSERKFIDIDRDKFNDVMARLKPRLELKVPDTISGDKDAEFKVELGFKSLSDFHPDQLVQNVPVLEEAVGCSDQVGTVGQCGGEREGGRAGARADSAERRATGPAQKRSVARGSERRHARRS